MATKVKDEPQIGLWDREVEDPALESLLDIYYALVGALEDAYDRVAHDMGVEVKDVRAAKAGVTAAVRALELEDDEKLRCGPYVVTGKSRAGGGFSVPAWRAVIVDGVAKVQDA